MCGRNLKSEIKIILLVGFGVGCFLVLCFFNVFLF